MFANMASTKHVTTHKDIEKVLAKSADDLAESLEIMMIETRPIGDHRTALRGAICMLRGESTAVAKDAALKIIKDLTMLWHERHMEARVLICKRAAEIIETPEPDERAA